MSISALNDLKCSNDEWRQIVNKRKIIKKHLRTIQGSSAYRMGYGAGYEGYNPDSAQLESDDAIYPGYAKGIKDGLRDGLRDAIWSNAEDAHE